MPPKRSKTPKTIRRSKRVAEKVAKQNEEINRNNEWAHLLEGYSGNPLIHKFLDMGDIANLTETSQEAKNYALETSTVEDIDDGRFMNAWNKAGIQDYYYSIPKIRRLKDGTVKTIMFVIPKNEAGELNSHRRYVYDAHGHGRRHRFQRIGLINKLDLGYKFKELFSATEGRGRRAYIHEVYDFPFNPSGKNAPLDIVGDMGHIVEIDIVLGVEPIIFHNRRYADMLRQRHPDIVTIVEEGDHEVPNRYNKEELTKAYTEECKRWFTQVFLNPQITKIPLTKNKVGWEKFKQNMLDIYNSLTVFCQPLTDNGFCAILGGGKKTKKKRKRKKTKRRKTKRKRKKRKKRKKTRRRR